MNESCFKKKITIVEFRFKSFLTRDQAPFCNPYTQNMIRNMTRKKITKKISFKLNIASDAVSNLMSKNHLWINHDSIFDYCYKNPLERCWIICAFENLPKKKKINWFVKKKYNRIWYLKQIGKAINYRGNWVHETKPKNPLVDHRNENQRKAINQMLFHLVWLKSLCHWFGLIWLSHATARLLNESRDCSPKNQCGQKKIGTKPVKQCGETAQKPRIAKKR